MKTDRKLAIQVILAKVIHNDFCSDWHKASDSSALEACVQAAWQSRQGSAVDRAAILRRVPVTELEVKKGRDGVVGLVLRIYRHPKRTRNM